jgi:hypothetical protein
MLLSRMRSQTIPFPPYRRKDGQVFQVILTAYQTPAEYDYWRLDFMTTHPEWGVMTFPMVALKADFPSIDIAKVLAGAAPWDLVMSALDQADANGRPMLYRPLHEGWMMLC